MEVVKVGVACVVLSAALTHYFSKLPRGCAAVTSPGLFGALPEIWRYISRHAAHSGLAEYHEKEGDTLFFSFGLLQIFLPTILITRDASNVRCMLKTHFDHFVKGEKWHAIGHDLLGEGIFNVDGESWYKQRKTASQMFTAHRFKHHIWRVLERNCAKVISLLKANQQPVVDLFNILNRFTLDSIGEIGFGASIGSLDNPVSPFLKSFDEAQRSLFLRWVLPGWRGSPES